MKHKILLGACALALPAAAFAQVENYLIDQYHTVPYFELDHLGFATMRGRFDRATGKFSLDRAAKSGVKYVIEPGGSNRDADVIQACDEYGMTMVFSGVRLFHH